MKVSTRTHYGLSAMSYLACRHGQGPSSAREIAAGQGLPAKYLEQLLATLKSAGLVKSLRGAGGGYVLTRPPAEIRLWEIYEVLEGELSPVNCLYDPEVCPNEQQCPTRGMWLQMTEALKQVLEQNTLEDFASEGPCNCLGRN